MPVRRKHPLRLAVFVMLAMMLLPPLCAHARPEATSTQPSQGPLQPSANGHLPLEYAGQRFELVVIDAADGECYVSLDDPGLNQFMTLQGLTIRWTDESPRKATIYGNGRYIHWALGSRQGLVDGQETRWHLPILVVRDAVNAISLRALAELLSFRLRALDNGSGYRFVARLGKVDLSSVADREVHLKASGPLDSTRVETTGRTTVISMTDVEWGLDKRTFDFGDISVCASGTGTTSDPLTVSVTVPEQWKTECSGRILPNQMSVRVVPAFTAPANQAPVTLTNIRHFKGVGDLYVMLDASAPVRKVWRFDAEHRLLTIDVPNAAVGASSVRLDSQIASVETEDLRTSTFPFARIRVTLRDGTGFEIGGDETRLAVRVAPVALLPLTATCGGDLTEVPTGQGLIVIDPGHGGSDPGAINRSLQLQEKDVTLDISLRLKAALERRGFRVAMTRDDDRDVSYAHSPDGVELGARVAVANSRNADLFVSIHCNSAPTSARTGTSYHWFKTADLILAHALEGSLQNGTGFSNHGLIRNRFYVLRHTTMPAVLVETAFISNAAEAQKLADPTVRQKIADNLADALALKFPASRGRGDGVSTRRP